MKFDFTILLPVLIAFGISVMLSPVMIPFLKKVCIVQEAIKKQLP